jgi:hypothetical protein
MQAICSFVVAQSSCNAVPRCVGVELTPQELLLVCGGSPKPGWGTKPDDQSTAQALESPKPGW